MMFFMRPTQIPELLPGRGLQPLQTPSNWNNMEYSGIDR